MVKIQRSMDSIHISLIREKMCILQKRYLVKEFLKILTSSFISTQKYDMIDALEKKGMILCP